MLFEAKPIRSDVRREVGASCATDARILPRLTNASRMPTARFAAGAGKPAADGVLVAACDGNRRINCIGSATPRIRGRG